MNIAAPFIKRPVATSLMSVALLLVGALAYRFLPVASLPSVEFPVISVQAILPGASPETMASSVATPLERQFGRIAGVTEMTSTSLLGATTLVLQFDLNRNIDAAARDVQAAINAARTQLPANLVYNPTYRKVNPADAPIMILALTSDLLPISRVFDAADSILAQKLAQVEGVGQVFVGGGAKPAVRVQVDPNLLSQLGLSLEQVRGALDGSTRTRRRARCRSDDRVDDQRQRPAVHGGGVPPRSSSRQKGAPVRLSDVAQVEESQEDIRTAGSPTASARCCSCSSGNRAPTWSRRWTGRRAPARTEGVDSAHRRLDVVSTAPRPSARRSATCRSPSPSPPCSSCWSSSSSSAMSRATIIPSVAIPLSLFGTFGGMYLLGYSLDNLSLMALTISTGFVVDDAIVVLENITRYIEAGESPLAAALRGAREIGFTVLSMSTSLVAVFIPILLMGGLVGRLFREFAVTLSLAIGVSLLVSLVHDADDVRDAPASPGDESRHGPALPGRRARLRRAAAPLRGHARRGCCVIRATTLAITLATVGVNIYLFVIVPKGFFPQQDAGRIVGNIQAEQDISFQAMRRKMMEFADTVMTDPAVDKAVAFTGGAGNTTNTGRMFIPLEAARGAQGLRRPGHQPAPRRSWPTCPARPVPPGRAGPAHRRPHRATRSTSTPCRARISTS